MLFDSNIKWTHPDEIPSLFRTDSSTSSVSIQSLTPRLDEDQGWYLIGEEADPKNRTFMLCITVAFAANLKHLLPQGEWAIQDFHAFQVCPVCRVCQLPSSSTDTMAFLILLSGVPIKCPSATSDSSGGFFFFYTLFGNSVTTDPFFDVIEPNFPSEIFSQLFFLPLSQFLLGKVAP